MASFHKESVKIPVRKGLKAAKPCKPKAREVDVFDEPLSPMSREDQLEDIAAWLRKGDCASMEEHAAMIHTEFPGGFEEIASFYAMKKEVGVYPDGFWESIGIRKVGHKLCLQQLMMNLHEKYESVIAKIDYFNWDEAFEACE